ncbi:MAG: HNH endonuclease [Prevotella sp.]|nr:HNH endonuclease [Prevotella sp.]
MVSINDFDSVKECAYRGECYSVRDNGAVMRHPRNGMRHRKYDGIWTFGSPNKKNGYMEIAGERVHRIVAYAFLGEPPSEQYVADHIDTNRKNNRPENLRWLTRLENILLNPITRKKIEYRCGSIEAFLANPELLKGYETEDANFSWMRTVTREEAQACLERWNTLKQEALKSHGRKIGEWIYSKPQSTSTYSIPVSYSSQPAEEEVEKLPNETQSLTANAVQVNWRTPSEFPCCPQEFSGNPLGEYAKNLKVGEAFCRNTTYTSVVKDFAIIASGNSLLVMCENRENFKPWSLAIVAYKDGVFFHRSHKSYFEQEGAEKDFTILQGKKWTGGDSIDDYC